MPLKGGKANRILKCFPCRRTFSARYKIVLLKLSLLFYVDLQLHLLRRYLLTRRNMVGQIV